MKSVYWCKLIVKTSQFSLKDKQNTTRRYWRKEKFARKSMKKKHSQTLAREKR